MSDFKAIETKYSGHRFRSRLEARWAVWLDSLGASWLYEHEGFTLDDGTKYLPDFWLPKVGTGCYLEIKPTAATKEETDKAARLADGTKRHVVIVAGNPWPGEYAITEFAPLRPMPPIVVEVMASVVRHRAHWLLNHLPFARYDTRAVLRDWQQEAKGACGPLSVWSKGNASVIARCFSFCDTHRSLSFGSGVVAKTQCAACGSETEDPTNVALVPRCFAGGDLNEADCIPYAEGGRLQQAFEAARGARFEHGEHGAA